MTPPTATESATRAMLDAAAQQRIDAAARPRLDPWLLRLRREAAGLTLLGLALRVVGWEPKSGRETLSRLENYRLPNVTMIRLRKLAAALGVERAALMSGGEEWQANRKAWQAWDDAGRPALAEWLDHRALEGGEA